jgi:glutathione S-transferase
MSEAVALELRRLQAEQAELRQAVEHLTRRLLAADDRRLGAALVPLLADVFDGAEFGAADIAAAALNGRDSGAQALRELVAEFCTESGGVRALGRVLARLEGVSFDGCRLQCVGERRGVQRWRVRVS